MSVPRQSAITGRTEDTSTDQAVTNSTRADGSRLNGPVDLTLYAFSIVLFGMSCYVVVVVFMYLHRFLRKRRLSQAKSTSSVLTNGFGKLGLCMRFVVAFISLLCFVHFILEQILLHSNCCDKEMKSASKLGYGFVVMSTYVFFWLRQRVLYDAPAMRLFNNNLLRFLSWLSLALVVITSITEIVTTSLVNLIAKPSSVYVFWLLGCVSAQVALMSLFLYPLKKHGNERRKTFTPRKKKRNVDKVGSRPLNPSESGSIGSNLRDSNIFTVCSSKNSSGSSSSVTRTTITSANPMYRAARRCVVCAAVSFATDIVTGIFMIFALCRESKSHEMEAIQRFLFDINLVINSVFVVGCLANWRYILFPKCFRSVANRAEYYPTKRASEFSVRERVIPNFHYRDEPR